MEDQRIATENASLFLTVLLRPKVTITCPNFFSPPQDDESDDEWDDEVEGDPNSKVFYAQVTSTRVDLIVKSCMGMARK